MICVVISRSRHKLIQVEVQEAARRGARLIEIRLDYLSRYPDFKRLLADKPCPLIATVRRREDGGSWTGTEEARQMVLRQAVVAGFDWVDVETDVADSIRRFKNVKRIVSYHNLQQTPDDLEPLYQRMCQQDADVVKVACAAQQPADNLRVLALLKDAPKPTVAVCLGEMGICSRLLGARWGAAFSYAVFNKDYRIVPGIPAFDELQQLYGYDQITAQTKVFGVVGDPLEHSLSPLVHNAAMRQLGVNGVYVPFRVPRGQLPAFLRDFEQVPVHGYSVTIPHKEPAASLASSRDEFVAQVHAANTLVRGEGGFAAYNTDAPAALASLRSVLPPAPGGGPASLERRQILILGAGGVARSIAPVLVRAGAQVGITNRTPERALQLAAEIGGRAVEWAQRASASFQILINCTSVGMHPEVDDTPMPATALRPGQIVMDTVYNPENTLLIKEARGRGCQVRSGVDMFVRQAAMQFRLFTGQEAPYELMHRLVKRALSPVSVPEE